MSFLTFSIIFPVFMGLLLGDFFRSRKKRRLLSLVVAAISCTLVVVYGWMDLEALIGFFDDSGSDPVYATVTALILAVIVRPITAAVTAFVISWIAARLRRRLVNFLVDRGDKKRQLFSGS